MAIIQGLDVNDAPLITRLISPDYRPAVAEPSPTASLDRRRRRHALGTLTLLFGLGALDLAVLAGVVVGLIYLVRWAF